MLDANVRGKFHLSHGIHSSGVVSFTIPGYNIPFNSDVSGILKRGTEPYKQYQTYVSIIFKSNIYLFIYFWSDRIGMALFHLNHITKQSTSPKNPDQDSIF